MDRDYHQEIRIGTRYEYDQLVTYTYTVSVPNDPDAREHFYQTENIVYILSWIYGIFGLIIFIALELILSLLFGMKFFTKFIIEVLFFVVCSTIYWVLGFMLMKKHFDLDPTNTNLTEEARDIIKQKRNFFMWMIIAMVFVVICVLLLFGIVVEVIVFIKKDDFETANARIKQFGVSFNPFLICTIIAIRQCVYSWKILKKMQRPSPSEEANDGPMVNNYVPQVTTGLDLFKLLSKKQKTTLVVWSLSTFVICWICLISCFITILFFLGAILGEDALVPASVRYQRFGIVCAISTLVLVFTIYIIRKCKESWGMLEEKRKELVPIPKETDEVISEESNVVV